MIRIIPPARTALVLYFSPKRFPKNTPIEDNINVTSAIVVTEYIMFTFKNAKDMPTARASMLVAIDKSSIVFMDKLLSNLSCSLERDSIIIFIPISDNKKNAM